LLTLSSDSLSKRLLQSALKGPEIGVYVDGKRKFGMPIGHRTDWLLALVCLCTFAIPGKCIVECLSIVWAARCPSALECDLPRSFSIWIGKGGSIELPARET